MTGAGLVTLGYVLGILHDLASYRRTPAVKPVLLVTALMAHVFGAWMLLVRSPRVALPAGIRRSALVLSVLTFAGMVYSIAVEIPFRKAWVDRGHTSRLISTGTYSVSRHPGVLWTSIWVPCAAVASGSKALMRWWPVVVAGDVAYVWIEDRFILPRVFGEEYREYQARVPFLIPLRIGRLTGQPKKQ
ncbi:MAG: hypothetical protein WD942_05445 [Dehalococcoidia bacterium]